jgi:mycofactocin precursor
MAAENTPHAEVAQAAEEGPAEELLVEEISIDGMCGVY